MQNIFRIRIEILLSFLWVVLSLPSCSPNASSEKSPVDIPLQAKLGSISIESFPDRWTPGDSLWIHVKSQYNQAGVISYSPMISTPMPVLDLVPGKDQSELSVCLSTDSISNYVGDSSFIEMEGYFDDQNLKIGIILTERFLIQLDRLERFYIKKDSDFYQLDTGELAVPIFEE